MNIEDLKKQREEFKKQRDYLEDRIDGIALLIEELEKCTTQKQNQMSCIS
jgi:prefoldin subunit 5